MISYHCCMKYEWKVGSNFNINPLKSLYMVQFQETGALQQTSKISSNGAWSPVPSSFRAYNNCVPLKTNIPPWFIIKMRKVRDYFQKSWILTKSMTRMHVCTYATPQYTGEKGSKPVATHYFYHLEWLQSYSFLKLSAEPQILRTPLPVIS